jgi:hypothetical protein
MALMPTFFIITIFIFIRNEAFYPLESIQSVVSKTLTSEDRHCGICTCHTTCHWDCIPAASEPCPSSLAPPGHPPLW